MPLAHSAVAVIETPRSFVLEGPVVPQIYKYNGIRLFGGSINWQIDADPQAAMIRELEEELLLSPSPNRVGHVWTGPYASEDRSGRLCERLFSVFHVPIGSTDELSLQVPDLATIVELPKATMYQANVPLTRIAAYGLGLTIARGYTMKQAA